MKLGKNNLRNHRKPRLARLVKLFKKTSSEEINNIMSNGIDFDSPQPLFSKRLLEVPKELGVPETMAPSYGDQKSIDKYLKIDDPIVPSGQQIIEPHYAQKGIKPEPTQTNSLEDSGMHITSDPGFDYSH